MDNLLNPGHLPLIAFRYKPSPSELVGKLLNVPIRRIFFTDENKYSEVETMSLHYFEEYAKKQQFEFPSTYKPADMLRQLQGHNYDVKKAFANCKEEIEWKASHLPVQMSDHINHILNLGFMYLHGRDNRFRPIIIFKPGLFNKELYPIEEWDRAMCYFIDFIMKHTFIPGIVENWNIIVDMTGIQLRNPPMELKQLFGNIQRIYRCRLYKLFIVNMPFFLNLLWKIAKGIIGQTIEAKASIIDSNGGTYDGLFEFINRGQLEKKFGGNAENVESGKYFPPSFVYDKYYSENEEKNDKDYLKRCEVDTFEDDDDIYYEGYSDLEDNNDVLDKATNP